MNHQSQSLNAHHLVHQYYLSTDFNFIYHRCALCPSHYPEIPWVSLTLLPFLRHCTPFSDLPPTNPSVKPHQFTPPLGGLDLAVVVMTIIEILLILEQMQRGLRQKEKRI